MITKDEANRLKMLIAASNNARSTYHGTGHRDDLRASIQADDMLWQYIDGLTYSAAAERGEPNVNPD